MIDHHIARVVDGSKTRRYTPRLARKGRKNNGLRDEMANTSSAKKMVRKIARRTEANKARRSRVRTFLRQVEDAISVRDKTAADAALRSAQPELHRAVTKGVFKKATVSRKLSRLSSRIKALSA